MEVPPSLTPREQDILDLLRSGRTNAEIAVVLDVSVNTVKTHVKSVFRKLGVRNRTQASMRTFDEAHDG